MWHNKEKHPLSEVNTMSFEQEEYLDYRKKTPAAGGHGSWSSRCLREIEQMDETIASLDRQLAKLKAMAFELDNGPLLRNIVKVSE